MSLEHPLGDRRANLRRAVDAHTDALRFPTPDTAPLDYASTQNNLGNTYTALATIEDRIVNLAQALAAYTEALRFHTPEAAPLDYAMTQNKPGHYLRRSRRHRRQGRQPRAGHLRLSQGPELPHSEPPRSTTRTQYNLGNTYHGLAALKDKATNLERAIAAYIEALRFHTPEVAPLAYAIDPDGIWGSPGRFRRPARRHRRPAGGGTTLDRLIGFERASRYAARLDRERGGATRRGGGWGSGITPGHRGDQESRSVGIAIPTLPAPPPPCPIDRPALRPPQNPTFKSALIRRIRANPRSIAFPCLARLPAHLFSFSL